jgi:hypothetical protein
MEMRDRIFATGVPAVIFQPVTFIVNLLNPWIYPFIVNEGRIMHPHPATLEITYLSNEDLAALMVAALDRPHEVAGRGIRWRTRGNSRSRSCAPPVRCLEQTSALRRRRPGVVFEQTGKSLCGQDTAAARKAEVGAREALCVVQYLAGKTPSGGYGARARAAARSVSDLGRLGGKASSARALRSAASAAIPGGLHPTAAQDRPRFLGFLCIHLSKVLTKITRAIEILIHGRKVDEDHDRQRISERLAPPGQNDSSIGH